VLQGLSPSWAVLFVVAHPAIAFVAMGAVVLVITGAEALYADMGHFGRSPIRRAWFFVVFPALTLNYLGQAALVLHHSAARSNPFLLLFPPALQLPIVILATVATIIASQAVISGAFSMARQCMQLGFLPRMTVRHTSNVEEGQIYVPQINTALAIGVVLLVLAFKTSDSLAAAYGIAVTGTFMCTAILAMVVFRRQFHWSRPAAILVFGALFLVDIFFFSANTVKIVEGGWVPLVMGLALTTMMTTWKKGRDVLLSRWKQSSMPLAPFLARLPQSRIIRVPGLAVFLTGNPDYVPTSLLHNLKHNKVLHENVLFVTVENEDVPEVSQPRRAEVSQLAPGVHRVILRYGFMESPNIPRALEDLTEQLNVRVSQASYFLGREVLVPGMAPKLSWWRRTLFLVMARNAVPATEFFRIPSDRVVELGVRITI
jgi:KUP system potassium uptake protein